MFSFIFRQIPAFFLFKGGLGLSPGLSCRQVLPFDDVLNFKDGKAFVGLRQPGLPRRQGKSNFLPGGGLLAPGDLLYLAR